MNKYKFIVIEPTNTDNVVVWTDTLTNDEYAIFEAVEAFFEELDIPVSTDVVEDATYLLEHGRNYWFDETYCFAVIEI